MTRHTRCLLASVLALWLIGAARAPAQSLTSGSLDVLVQDSAGAPVGDARVVLTETATGVEREVTTTRDGRTRVNLLPVGDYSLLVERLGYAPARMSRIPIRPGRRLRLEVAIAAGRPPFHVATELNLPAAALGGPRGGAGQWFSETDLITTPGAGYGVGEILRLSSVADETLGAEGLPPHMSSIVIDGIPVHPARSSLLSSGAALAPAFPLSSLRAAELVTNGVDVEFGGPGGVVLHGYSRPGGGDLHARTFGAWSWGLPGDAGTFGSDGGQALQGGILVSGSVIRDTATFVLGMETYRLSRPVNSVWAADSLLSRVAAIARDRYDLSLGDPVDGDGIRSEVLTLFGRFDWRLHPSHALRLRGSFANVPSAGLRPRGLSGWGFGSVASGSELSAGAALASHLADGVDQEIQLGVSIRRFDIAHGLLRPVTAPGSGDVPRTVLAGSGVELDAGFADGHAVDESSVRLSETLVMTAGSHLLKLGLVGELATYAAASSPSGEFVFSAPEDFASGRGVYVQTLGTVRENEISVPRLGVFVQDTWTAAPGLDLVLGLRFDAERLPRGELTPNEEWLRRTGIANVDIPASAQQVSPRLGFTWDIQQRHRWLVHGAAGIYAGYLDPGVLRELLVHDGSVQVRRDPVDLSRWPAVPNPGAPVLGPELTLLAPDFTSPRTARGSLGISRLFGDHTTLSVTASYRHTDWLPRRADLNLQTAPSGEDQYGRPFSGELLKIGGLLTVENGSNRRFADFGRVSAINIDGWSSYAGATVSLEHRVGDWLNVLGSYTHSQTRDNWLGAQGEPELSLLDPFPFGSGPADWTAGRSDFDVPHRLVARATLRDLLLPGASLSVLYRFRSGYPFTPGFPAGVDANGDGSDRNDPAFVDPELPGMGEILSAWSCLRDTSDGFVQRNACRTGGIHSLDARFGIRLGASDGYSAELVVEGLGLLRSRYGYPNTALYRLDSSVDLRTDPQGGRTLVPLLVNPSFGEPVVHPTTGRMLRVGLRLTY